MARGERVAFVDAREDGSWNAAGQRLAGAVRVRLPSLVRDATQVPRGCPVVVYGADDRDLEVARIADGLRVLGYPEVKILSGGFAEWQQLRYPLQKKDPEQGKVQAQA
jgi:rhodanese-related sulfurtransferase